MRYGWDHPLTAERYAEFCAKPTRYRFANDALVRAAEIEGSPRVLDVAAGLGHTARAVLDVGGPETRVVCVEPALAMRVAGERRLSDPRVEWTAELPTAGGFDRIVCGAALWQLQPVASVLPKLRALLAERGRLCFSIPSLYLGIADRPGGGNDPCLVELMARLAKGRTPVAEAHSPPPSEAELVALLGELGLATQVERIEYRLTQSELRNWLRIPVLTDALLFDLDVEERDRRLDAAFAETDPSSYRFEGWTVVSAALQV